MIKYLLILALLLPCGIFAQKSEIFKIASLPKEGIVLDKNWKFHVGDNPEWAIPVFNDSDWNSINPALNIITIPSIKSDSSIWLRLKINVLNLERTQLSLAIKQSGASQVFLNGKKIADYGVISNNRNEIIAVNPLNKPLLFFSDSSAVQTLAVRYAFQPGINYRPMFNFTYPLFKATIALQASAIEQYSSSRYIALDSFKIGIYLMLFVIHIIFFMFYSQAKSNLFLAIWALFSIISTLYFVLQYAATNVAERNFNTVISLITGGISNISLLYSIYLLLKQKPQKLFMVFISFSVFSSVYSMYGDYVMRDYISFIFTILSVLFVVSMAFKAFKQKINGALYIVWGCILFMIFWTLFFLSLVFHWGPTSEDIFFHLSIFVFPISISAMLGLEIKFINKSLAQKLAEVKTLSNEKQQILAAQNEKLEQKVKDRTAALSASLEDLKSTQSQLIQKEKMASLGELTAGIAHEIQNPLNFVNNFSEVNKELLIEMKDEMKKGNLDDANEIANDVIANEEKINHHGKRADAIVKGMLQHSQISISKKEPTDINKLADEYLRLSYHGLRAKDKSFNATMKTDFDETIGNINIIPQDIGRVLLNLFNNAFYAVAEKKKQSDNEYQPIVTVSTSRSPLSGRGPGGDVTIKVSDNGNGISQKIVDKIFQPFFTTKPTGRGTGLGLSLSYDIIKAHGGEIRVETKEDEGTAFIIEIPK